MRVGDPINALASAVYSACLRDLPDIEYQYRKPGGQPESTETKRRRPRAVDCEVYLFPQTWSSTALGFGGIGGQAMTTADTVVVSSGRSAAVYFGGNLAYVIHRPTSDFWEDVRRHSMESVSKATRYEAA